MSPPYWKLYMMSSNTSVCDSPSACPDSCRQVKYTMASRSNRSPFTRQRGWPHVNLRARVPFENHRRRLAVHALLRRCPIQANARMLAILHAREFEFPARRLLPRFKRPHGQLRIVGLAHRRRIGARLHPVGVFDGRRRKASGQQAKQPPPALSHLRSASRSSASNLSCASSCSIRLLRSSINWPSGSGSVPCSR